MKKKKNSYMCFIHALWDVECSPVCGDFKYNFCQSKYLDNTFIVTGQWLDKKKSIPRQWLDNQKTTN